MAATATAPPPLSPSVADVGDQEDSNISSPLSEVDDKDANDADINMHLHDGDENESTVTGEGQLDTNPDGSDSDSDLSEARSVAHSDANDTEAETERLYDTPRNQRQRDVVVDQYNEGQVFEHTPSKLRSTNVLDDEKHHADAESLPDDAASEASERSDADESPSKVATTKDTSVDDDNHLHDSQDRKRKRSLATDGSDPEQPLRKRTASVVATEADADHELAGQKEVAAVANELSHDHSVAASPEKQDASAEENSTERETRARKKTPRRGSKRKGSGDSADRDATADVQEEVKENGVEDEQEQHHETIEAEADEEADIAAKNAEEAERKQAAFKDWSRIEEMFGVFRDRLYKDRLQRLEEEEQSLLAPEPTHREYLNMKQCLDDRLNRKLQVIEKEHEYRMKANERRAVAIRSQVWSQFAQGIREKREALLEALNRDWYDIQAARRKAHSTGDCGLLFPKEPSQRLRNAVAYNTEVSTLASIAKYEGFPAGPDINGASPSELNDDLNAIQQARRLRQRPALQAREEYQPPSFNHIGPAGEKFLQETPWANPNHSAHKAALQQLNPARAAGRAEQAVIAGRGAPPAQANSAAAAVDGPISQQRSPAPTSRPAESPELARTALRPGNSIKRTNLPTHGRESKAAAA